MLIEFENTILEEELLKNGGKEDMIQALPELKKKNSSKSKPSLLKKLISK